MAINLEDLEARFHSIQKSFDLQYSPDLASGGLRDFFGTFNAYCCTGASFEDWYSTHQSNVALFNGILTENKAPEITERELREVYECTQGNIEKNLAEERKRCDGENGGMS
jgi:hypothetical protein